MMPNDPRFQQAVTLAQSGQSREANAIFRQLNLEHPNDIEALVWIAYTTNNAAEAKDIIDRAERLAPGHPQVAAARTWFAQYQPEPAYQAQPNYQAQTGYQPNMGYQSQGGYQPNMGYQPSYAYLRDQKIGWGDRFGLGWAFMKQCFKMLSEDSNLIKPAIYSLIASLLAAVFIAFPILIIGGISKNNVVMYTAIFIASALLYFITYFCSSMTISLVYQNLTTGRSDMTQAWNASKQKATSILGVAAISAIFSVLRSMTTYTDDKNIFLYLVTRLVIGIMETIWTAYTYFVLPVIMIEHLGVGDAVKRSTKIIKDNLLQIGVGYLGVGLVTGLISIGSFLTLLIISIAIFAALSVASAPIAAVVALLIFILGMGIVSAFTSYLRTSYYTCLVLWAKSVEQQGPQAAPPAPIRTVLNNRGFAPA